MSFRSSCRASAADNDQEGSAEVALGGAGNRKLASEPSAARSGLQRQGGLYESATSQRVADLGGASSAGPSLTRADSSEAVELPRPPGAAHSPDLFRLERPSKRAATATTAVAAGALQQKPAARARRPAGGAATKRTSRWHAKRLRAETKAAKTVAIIVGGFIFCWLPFFTAYLTRALLCSSPACVPQSWLSLFIWLGYLNSAINPVIYGLFSADFRHAFKNIVCQCRLRGHQPRLRPPAAAAAVAATTANQARNRALRNKAANPANGRAANQRETVSLLVGSTIKSML